MDFTTISAIVGPIGTILAAGSYVIRLEGRQNTLTTLVAEREKFQDLQHQDTKDRLDRIEGKVDKVVDALIGVHHG